ncbi:bifunctional diguanylate cyclase/phosphodiesterase [Modestobacter sp. Leaf380]|uniref:putative bifunctional diguanylate cyclase/phosphodiesterase n=1 Tax=Modestobacter sp. Leaf380 TaxID=1736356 RepID=UPI000A70F212|nr:EAL domain-containing protein [Modestobacter sp. Leaf380]
MSPSALRPAWAAVPTPVVTAVFHSVAVTDGAAVLVVDASGPGVPVVTWGSAGVERLLGYALSDVPGRPLSAFLPDLPAGLLRAERASCLPLPVRTVTGALVEAVVLATPSTDPGVWALRFQAGATDAERVLADTAAAHERRFSTLTERSPVPTLLSDHGMRLAHVNDAFCRLTGRQAEQLLGTGWLADVHPDDVEELVDRAAEVLTGGAVEVRVRMVRADGAVRSTVARFAPLEAPGGAGGFVGTIEDVTERLEFEAQLAHLAHHDPLTGLPNRTRLADYVADRFVPGGRGLACLFLDVDDFKVVNDSLGHAAGDQLLVQVATRLRSVVRPSDLVVRFGGDEFVVVCERVSEDDAVALAGRIGAELARPVQLGGVSVSVRVSVGVTVQTDEHVTADELVRDCDIAMYQAKADGKGRVSVLDQDSRAQARDKLRLVADLRSAIEDGGLRLAFQPVVETVSRRPVGVEALARWTHPTRGPIGPQVFVALAEESGLVDALGTVVLEGSCAQVARWDAELGPAAPRVVNVNVSALQLDEHLPAQVASALQRHGVGADRLCVEITESALVRHPERAARVLGELRALGVRIAVDDFGTGWSSLATLRHLPVDCLKVDRSFVAELADGRPQITSAVVALAASLGLESTAEGVETEEQARALGALGATHLQGFGIATPMDAADTTAWFAAQAARAAATSPTVISATASSPTVVPVARRAPETEEFVVDGVTS